MGEPGAIFHRKKQMIAREFHLKHHAVFGEVNGAEVVSHYGDALAEHAALGRAAGVLDLSFRSRFCLGGADRVRFLNGQVTNNVKELAAGEGCYAALVTAKGKLESDLSIYRLPNELLLDFEPGMGPAVAQRLEKYIIADDVQVVDVSPHYGLLSIQGPLAVRAIQGALPAIAAPAKPWGYTLLPDKTAGEVYLMNRPRTGSAGFDLFAPMEVLPEWIERMAAAVLVLDGRICGWQALDLARFEAGIPRYGVDMDESNLVLETGIEEQAISYHKGCYIGQEVIARVHSHGHVTKALSGLRLADDLPALPRAGDKLNLGNQEVGYVTSAYHSPLFKANLALAYVRSEANQPGVELVWRNSAGNSAAKIVRLPFAKNWA